MTKTKRHGITFPPETKVQQKFKDEVNMATIVERFASGQMPQGNNQQPQYLDLTQIQDYHSMLNRVTETRQAFARLPSKIRARFKNNPSEMVSFVQDNANMEEAIKMGLVPKPKKTPLDEAIKASDEGNRQNGDSTPTKPKKGSQESNKGE